MKDDFSLEKKLRQYSIMAVPLLVSASTINAQIVYTDVVPDITVGPFINNMDTYALDLNNDGISDFMFTTFFNGSNYAMVQPFPQNAIGASVSGGSAFPYALDNGQVIDGNLNWMAFGDIPNSTLGFPASWQFLEEYYQDASYSTWLHGNWNEMSDKFLPLRLSVNNNIHYGWARLDVPLSSYPFTIKDYAYHSIPGQLIQAGDTSGSVSALTQEVSNERDFVVYMNPGTAEFMIESLFDKVELSIFNDLGQKVLEKHISSKEFLNLSNLPSGIYIVHLQHADTILKEKIMIE